MPSVFISHSRRDKKLVKEIKLLLENVGIKPVIEEIIDPKNKKKIPWKEIYSNIFSSNAVFLFLTEEVLRTEYTKNWVIFECGLASALGKQLFLFERYGDKLDYPIPYLSDYMIFDKELTTDILKIQKYSKELKKYFSSEETLITSFPLSHPVNDSIENMFLMSLYLSWKTRSKKKKLKKLGVEKVNCPRCKASFYYYSPEKSPFTCPSCLEGQIELGSK